MSVYSRSQIQQMVVDAANKYGVPPQLALGLANKESSFNASAVSPANKNGTRDYGVMQLNDATIVQYGVQNALDPQENIDVGVKLLGTLLGRYGGDEQSALWAYNAGPGNVRPGSAPPASIQSYIDKILGYGTTTATTVTPGIPTTPILSPVDPIIEDPTFSPSPEDPTVTSTTPPDFLAKIEQSVGLSEGSLSSDTAVTGGIALLLTAGFIYFFKR